MIYKKEMIKQANRRTKNHFDRYKTRMAANREEITKLTDQLNLMTIAETEEERNQLRYFLFIFQIKGKK